MLIEKRVLHSSRHPTASTVGKCRRCHSDSELRMARARLEKFRRALSPMESG